MMRVAELEKQLLQREKELESIKVPSNQRREVPGWCWVPRPGNLFFFLSHVKSLRIQTLVHDLEVFR